MSLAQITDLVGLPVVDLDTGDILGEVESWVVSVKDQKILAYVLRRANWLAQLRVLSTLDVAEYAPEMLVVRSQESIIDPKEIVGLPDLIDAKVTLIGWRAEDATGKTLGKVHQLVFEIATSLIQKYYIQPVGLLGVTEHNLVLTRNQVVSIDGNKIVFAVEKTPRQLAADSAKLAEPT